MRFIEAVTAYRPQNSYETTLLRLIENWKEELGRKNYVGVLTWNMSKTFDSLCPALLIKKLQAYTLSENTLNLIRTYFDQREYRVKIGPVTMTGKPFWRDVLRVRRLVPLCGTSSTMIYPCKLWRQVSPCTPMITKSTRLVTRVREWKRNF